MKLIFLFLNLSFISLFIACSSDAGQKKASVSESSVTPTSEVASTPPKEGLDAMNPVSTAEINARLVTEPKVAATPTSVAAKKGEAIKVSDKKEAPKPSKPIEVIKKEAPKPQTQQPVIIEPKQENKSTPTIKEKKEIATPPAQEPETKVDDMHDSWNSLLQKHVSSNGTVNYKGFKADLGKLTTYLTDLSGNPVQNDWSRGEKMAYWINVYNAYTIKLILDNYPVKSITDLEGGKPWDKKWIKLGDRTYSLNDIENNILRPQFKEPGIHFAVNCAAKSCPPLLNKAWTAENLNANFKKQATAFINNPSYNEISATSVKLSKIFDWYQADFGDLVSYLNKYSKTTINDNASITYKEYDWQLNE